MAFPEHARFLIIGAGIHGLSAAWRLGERLSVAGTVAPHDVVVVDKSGVAAGASGIACGVVRNNYFQSAMRALMAHSVEVWESDPDAFAYHSVGYLQICPEAMRSEIAKVYSEQREIGYASTLIEGQNACTKYMRGMFGDWRAQNITAILHEHRGGFANNTKSLEGLARKAEALGARILSGVTVTGFRHASGSPAISHVETDRGSIAVDQVIVAVGPWVRDLWDMLSLPSRIAVRTTDGKVDNDVPMWRFWQLEEGVLDVPPDTLLTDSGKLPPVLHVDSDAPLRSDSDGSLVTEGMWGVYFKPDFHFNGVQGGAAPYRIDMAAEDVAIDPYGPASPQFVSSPEFATMWTAALAHCLGRFQGKAHRYRNEPAGGIGCFTADSFPIFDRFHDNVHMVADSNHGYKMIGVGRLVADEALGERQPLLEPFRFSRFARGDLHPASSSPFPWS